MSTILKSPASFNFPFEPYKIQHEFMKKLYEVIENRCLGIFESPTGTGKSLSIICAAIRWLKDHNERERCDLANQINLLELEKQKLSQSDGDWITAQAQEIEVNRKLNSLKIENNTVLEYDKKLQALLDKKKRVTKQKYFKPKTDDVNIEDSTKTTDDDEDLILEELNVNLSENELSDEENENKYEPVKVFICSRTHSQLSQFVGEIIKSPFGDNVRVVTLSSRQNYCINTNVNKLKNVTLINEKCLDLQRSKAKTKKADDGKSVKKAKISSCKCEFYKQEKIEELRDVILYDVQDIEDLVTTAKVIKSCPYYASRKAAEDAEVVLIPYNTILHKPTREANGIKLKNNIIIIDEAHNLLEAMAQMYSTDLTYPQLFHSHQQLKNYKTKFSTRFSSSNLLCINQLIFIINKLMEVLDKSVEQNLNDIHSVGNFVSTAEIDNYNMFKLIKFCKNSKIGHKLHGFSVKHPQEANSKEIAIKKGIKHFLNSIENRKDGNKTADPVQQEQTKPELIPMNPLLSVISFLEVLTYSYDDGRIMIKKSNDKSQRKLQFLLLNATEHFKDVVKEARAVIVAGGTMKPIAEFRNRLFVSAGAVPDRIVEFSCDHIISPENILPIILTRGSKQETLLFNYENRFAMGNAIKSVLEEACKLVSGGIVVFFPSYKYENWIWQQLKDVHFGRPVFREPQQSSGVDGVLESYAKAIRKSNSSGALMFSVVGGKLSEGLNFSDNLGRCVVVVGMPYANIFAADLKEKMAYLDKLEGNGAGQKFYESLCMKAVNQCIGRAVRHKDDYATVILLDERYNRASTKNSLPDWIKRSLKTCAFTDGFSLIEKVNDLILIRGLFEN